jgi:hypothetical protein
VSSGAAFPASGLWSVGQQYTPIRLKHSGLSLERQNNKMAMAQFSTSFGHKAAYYSAMATYSGVPNNTFIAPRLTSPIPGSNHWTGLTIPSISLLATNSIDAE